MERPKPNKMTSEPDHQPGDCWCGIAHTVAGAAELNGVYDQIITRTEGGPDPLVKEPRRGSKS